MDSQEEDESMDPYNINNDKSFDDDVNYEPREHRNGVIKKLNKKKKLTSGPGRGRPRKAHITMYQSQISGDKNTIKIRIKKSNFCTQVRYIKVKTVLEFVFYNSQNYLNINVILFLKSDDLIIHHYYRSVRFFKNILITISGLVESLIVVHEE